MRWLWARVIWSSLRDRVGISLALRKVTRLSAIALKRVERVERVSKMSMVARKGSWRWRKVKLPMSSLISRMI